MSSRVRDLLSVLALSVMLILGVAGCGDDDEAGSGDEGSTTTTTEATTTTTTDPAVDEQAVVDAYVANWESLIKAGEQGDPDAEHLADHLAGEQLERHRSALSDLASEGVVLRGTYETDARVIELDAAQLTAVVEDCGMDRIEAVLESSGRVVETFDDEPDGVRADLSFEDGAWKVIDITTDDGVCS